MAVRIDILTIKGIVGKTPLGDVQPLEIPRHTKEKIVADCVKQVLKIINKTNTRQHGGFLR